MDLITGGLYQGQENYIKENYKSSFELLPFVCEYLKAGEDETGILDKVFEKTKEAEAVLAVEIGAGMIPVDPLERELREIYGRTVCELSKRADRVIRMVCGLTVVIK